MLALEVEWLMSVCWATASPSETRAEWPVQPDRLFSALVATWGAQGQPDDGRLALQWLESLPPPRLFHAGGGPRTVVTTFVPPNDDAPLNFRVLPSSRRRQPRQFPATVLRRPAEGAHLRLVWSDDDPDFGALRALETIARDTSYVGHSASVVRCRFRVVEAIDEGGLDEGVTLAAPHRGRLTELESLHDAHLRGNEKSRPDRTRLAATVPLVRAQMPCSVFGPSWIVLAHAGGARPDVRATPVVARMLRRALMARYPDPVPAWLSGHEDGGAPARTPHMAVVPLSRIGGAYADGTLMGLAIVLPRELDALWQDARAPAAFDERVRFDQALRALREAADDAGEPAIALPCGGSTWQLRRVTEPGAFNLRPGNYTRAARCWATVTPIALDRFPGDGRVEQSVEAAETVAAACVNTGLPRPIEVRLAKHASFAGAVSAWPSGGAPAWTGWARPGALANRPLVHATLGFANPVLGPVMLGAGRFVGLGLCRPAE